MLTSGLGPATEPGHVKVTNSWHLLWTTKLQTVETQRWGWGARGVGDKKKKMFKMNQYHKEDYQKGRNAEEIKGKFICTLTLESLFADAPEWKKKRRMDLNTN